MPPRSASQGASEMAPASQISPPESTLGTAQDDIRLNCILFDKSPRKPFVIWIPRNLYEQPSQLCQTLFVKPLFKRYRVVTMDDRIAFWTPNTPLSADVATKKGWATSIVDIDAHFTSVPNTSPFSRRLTVDDDELIHLIITIEDEGLAVDVDQVPELKEFSGSHVLAKAPEAIENLKDLERLRDYLWGEDKVKITSVAGKSYSTIDLTLFELSLNARPDDILLVREEYIVAYDTILADTRQTTGRRRSATLVTGQPGIGKTLFLLYVLARRLQEKEPVALQISADEFALFDDHGVSLHSSQNGRVPKGAWALSDSSPEHIGICAAFAFPSGAHIIHTSSPASRHWKHWVKHLSALKYIMDVWSLEELQTLFTIKNLDVQRGKALFQKFGPSVRIIIDIVLEEQIKKAEYLKEDQYLNDVQEAADDIAKQFSTVFLALQRLNFNSDFSSKIFIVRPNVLKSRQPALYIPTPFLTSTLGVAMSRQAVAQQHTFFAILSGHPSLRSAAGWLFENYAHLYFSDPNHSPIQAYLRNQSLHCIPTPSHIITGSTALQTIQPPHNFYWRPQEPNFEGVDAVIRADDIVWALQFTISASHRPATGGLAEVRNKMNHKKDVDWNLVMVGPEQRNAELARNGQRLDGQWAPTPVYACVLPLGQFTQDDQQLENILNERIDMYPGYQAADSDVSMSEPL